jgi:hypothetical protein
MIKIEGSASGSGSISQRHGSADPDPHQNVMDPQHWLKGRVAGFRNTDYVFGCVVYTGKDTKMSQNSKSTANKFSTVEVTMNKAGDRPVLVFLNNLRGLRTE